MTHVRLECLLAEPAVDRELVVVGELFAGADRAPCLDEHAATLVFVSDAIRVAGVIDPARGVAAAAGVDDVAVFELENERVLRVVRVAVGAPAGNRPRRAVAAIFDDRRPFADRPRCEDAPAVDRGAAYAISGLCLGCGHHGNTQGGTASAIRQRTTGVILAYGLAAIGLPRLRCCSA